MAKKDKKRFDNPDYILARAERLFKSGNYQLAQLEFEKAGEVINSPEIFQKAETCRRLAERARADDLVKRAKKHLGKGNVHEAMTCFVEANRVLRDGEIEKKIDQLRQRREGLEAERDARRAEADGQYQEAAELYKKAFEGRNNDLYALKTAHCLVRAGRHEEAVLIFERYRTSDDWAIYDYGFALARLGRFFECLQVWDRISSSDQGLKGQRQHVRALLHDALFERFERDRDYAGIYREGSYLLASEDDKSLSILVEYCKYAWIDELWKQERHDVIAGLLPDFSSPIDPAHLLLKAKNTFKLMEASKVIEDDLPMLWLTAIYGEAFKQLSCDEDKKERVREELLHLAEAMLTEAADAGQGPAKDLLTIWNIEKRRIKDLHSITNDDDNLIPLVCTPQYAMSSGVAGRVLNFIKKHRKSFKSREDYLLLGSYYSPACKALLHMDMGRMDQEMACLRDIAGKDDFTRYGVMRAD